METAMSKWPRRVLGVWCAVMLVMVLGLVTSTRPAVAAVGDLLRTVDLPAPAQCGIGTSVALVAGTSVGLPQYPVLLVMSCWNDAKLFFFDPTVTNPTAPVLTVTTTGGPPGGWGSLALRGNRGDLLACANQDASGNLGIYRIPLSRSLATTP